MRERSFILVVMALAVLFIGAAGVYVYDSSRDDVIAEGVTVGGVDVGGLTSSEAEEKLSRELLPRYRQPVVAKFDKRRFILKPQDAGVNPNLKTMVQLAVERSRKGNIASRVLREVTGGTVDEEVPPAVTFSDKIVSRYVARIQRKVDRKPQDAEISISGAGVVKKDPKDGLAIDHKALRRDVELLLGGRSAPRDLIVQTKRTKPSVTRAELPQKYPTLITIDRANFKLRFYKNLELVETYTVAVGAAGFDTPAGFYSVTDKAVDPTWHVPDKDWAGDLRGQVIPGGASNNPLKARWLGFYNGAGIHGTAETGSLGSAASHGCIRMAVPDVVELYERVPVQTPLYIA